jgi:phosphoribosylglycinamide formyltransferase 1
MAHAFKVVVCASGGGGNFQALVDSREAIGFEISLLVTDRPCGAVQRATENGIAHRILDSTGTKERLFLELDAVIPQDTHLIVLAGFLPILPGFICDKWRGRIINTHPSLLPKYGGKGMYGVKVHEAVMKARERITGCTVHYVTPDVDGGDIILQEVVEVDYGESPWELGARVFKEETRLLPAAVRLIKERVS